MIISEPQVATLEELSTVWSLDDVAKAISMLDMRSAIEQAASKQPGSK